MEPIIAYKGFDKDFKFDDIKIENYESYPSIKFPLSN